MVFCACCVPLVANPEMGTLRTWLQLSLLKGVAAQFPQDSASELLLELTNTEDLLRFLDEIQEHSTGMWKLHDHADDFC